MLRRYDEYAAQVVSCNLNYNVQLYRLAIVISLIYLVEFWLKVYHKHIACNKVLLIRLTLTLSSQTQLPNEGYFSEMSLGRAGFSS